MSGLRHLNSSVSETFMKWRYSILLPLLHMVLSGILIFSEESRTWNFATFHWSDEEILNPTTPRPGEIAFDSGYEFRPRTGVKVIMGAECPAYLLIGWYGRPAPEMAGFRRLW
jgi:hypothetical protein